MSNEKLFSPFYTSFLALCSQKGVAPSVAARDSGISSGAPTAWKNGAIPKPAQREKLCAYFGVSDEVLLGYKSAEKAPAPEGEHEMAGLSDIYFSLAKDLQDAKIDPEDIRNFARIIAKNMQKSEGEI